MDELERLKIQWAKLENGYKTMTSEEIATLREKVLLCFPSEEMRNYLREHFDELGSSQLIEIIVGAHMPIAYKAELMNELTERFPHPFEELDGYYDFEVYVKLYQKAFNDMRIADDEKAIYLLQRYYYDEEDGAIPFFTFEDARNYIPIDVEEQACDEEDADRYWYEIEKWDGFADEKCKYTLSRKGVIWNYDNYSDELLDAIVKHRFGVCNKDLNLPVPFSVGDVITVDCRPSALVSHAVLLNVGDNRDCCCVQGLYVKQDGTVDYGALKHGHAQDFMAFSPEISPLYNAARFYGELPPEEAFMKELGEILAKLSTVYPEKYEEEHHDIFREFGDSSRTSQELMEKVKRVASEWANV